MYKFDTNRITNSKIAAKMLAVQGYGCISSVYISFEVVKLNAFRRMAASMLRFLVWVGLIKFNRGHIKIENY